VSDKQVRVNQVHLVDEHLKHAFFISKYSNVSVLLLA